MDPRKKLILVVDDEESIRNGVARKLEAAGYDCVIAADGNEALWATFMQDFDLVLTDIKMPRVSGMEVLSRVVADHPDVGVIMMTAIADVETAVDAMRQGAYDYVTKPFKSDDLIVRVEKALEKRALVLENREYQERLEQKVERQVGQITQYYREAIQALAREQMALEELNALRKTAQTCDKPEGAAVSGYADSASPVKGFAEKLCLLLDGDVSERSDQACGRGMDDEESRIDTT
jgi:DNA-binding NtrC family response regulator